jgi:DNA-binding transcriptional LysR family regulator
MGNMKLANNALHDLNLVRVFLTIWDTRSLTAAGQRLSLTQPAVSHALRRLRESFDDPLFVRITGGMVPTEMATRLYTPFSEALKMIHHAVQDSDRFAPLTDQRIFRVAMSDVSEFCFLPMLMGWLSEAAPAVHLKIVSLDPATVVLAMRTGEVDLAVGYLPDLEDEDEVTSHYLLTDSFVCLVRDGHPAIRSNAGAVDIGALGYIFANSMAPGHQMAERWLTEIGVRRKTILRLAHFTVAPSIVRSSDLAVIFPESIARMINQDGAFALLPLPPGQPVVDIGVHTHVHFRGDAGIRWLRESIVKLFASDIYPAPP